MLTILDGLKLRLAAAQARQTAAQVRYQAAQAEINAANAELGIWTNAVNIETREENLRVAESAKNQLPMNLQSSDVVDEPVDAGNSHADEQDDDPINKTDFIRDLLRQNSTGMTPASIWSAFHQKTPKTSRSYLYSVLKRLRDKDEVTQRRGKYVLKFKPTATSDGEGEPNQEGMLMN